MSCRPADDRYAPDFPDPILSSVFGVGCSSCKIISNSFSKFRTNNAEICYEVFRTSNNVFFPTALIKIQVPPPNETPSISTNNFRSPPLLGILSLHHSTMNQANTPSASRLTTTSLKVERALMTTMVSAADAGRLCILFVLQHFGRFPHIHACMHTA